VTKAALGTAAVAAIVTAATMALFAAPPQAGAADDRTIDTVLSTLTVQRNFIILPRLHRADVPMTTTECREEFGVSCYSPAQIQRAYQVGGLYAHKVDGRGQTIVVIDEFGSPTIGADLATFDKQTGLPAATLDIVHPVGKIPPLNPGNPDQVGWAGETTLDVEWAHVIAPEATLVLEEVPSQGGLLYGLQYAIDHRLGDVITLSWSGAERGTTVRALQSADALLFKPAARKRITIVDATGDLGASGAKANGSLYTYPVVNWPASDPDVVGVGGTSLHLNDSGERTSADTVWNDTYNAAANFLINGIVGPFPLATGGGKSVVFGWPYYQAKVGKFSGWRRGVPDISMSAACSGAVDIYASYPGQLAGWTEVCGTSESAPLFAGVVALADQAAGRPLGNINPALYRIAAASLPGIVPVTSGNNTVAFVADGTLHTVTGYQARDGYSLAAGLGTINARFLIPELAHPQKVKPKHAPKPTH
jgi:subtilase family serine protease